MDGKYINANPYFLEIFGFTHQKLSKTDSLESVHPEYHEFYKLAANECIENPGVRTIVILKKPTGENKYAYTRWEVTFISDVDESYIQCIGVDVTDQITSTDSLQKIQQKILSTNKVIDNLLSNSIDIILVVDMQCNISFCSPNIFKELGYEPEELIGKNGFSFIHPEDLGAAIKIFEDEVKQPNQNKSVDVRYKKKDGSWLWAETKGKNMLADPLVEGIIINLNNITARKRVEEELILKERSLQKQIANAAFNAQEKERSNISKELHDNVSQMLTSTKLFLDILRNKAPDELIDRSIKNINSIIEEIRNMSRSLMPLSIEELGIIGSINDLIDNIRVANIIDFEFYPDNEVEKLLNANSKLILYRIVQEQINNIVKHAKAKNILIELFAENNSIELILSDDGTGFDLESVKKGLGLRNMTSRAQLLNGTTEIITKPNKGCKFKVHIPYQ